jgi:hypothetical protein
VKGLKR